MLINFWKKNWDIRSLNWICYITFSTRNITLKSAKWAPAKSHYNVCFWSKIMWINFRKKFIEWMNNMNVCTIYLFTPIFCNRTDRFALINFIKFTNKIGKYLKKYTIYRFEGQSCLVRCCFINNSNLIFSSILFPWTDN